MSEWPTPNMPAHGERVCATGICAMCDFKFTNEIVARYPAPFVPGGWAYVELRHLNAAEFEALRDGPLSAARRPAAQP
jgi:hypothetical protein